MLDIHGTDLVAAVYPGFTWILLCAQNAILCFGMPLVHGVAFKVLFRFGLSLLVEGVVLIARQLRPWIQRSNFSCFPSESWHVWGIIAVDFGIEGWLHFLWFQTLSIENHIAIVGHGSYLVRLFAFLNMERICSFVSRLVIHHFLSDVAGVIHRRIQLMDDSGMILLLHLQNRRCCPSRIWVSRIQLLFNRRIILRISWRIHHRRQLCDYLPRHIKRLLRGSNSSYVFDDIIHFGLMIPGLLYHMLQLFMTDWFLICYHVLIICIAELFSRCYSLALILLRMNVKLIPHPSFSWALFLMSHLVIIILHGGIELRCRPLLWLMVHIGFINLINLKK